MRSRGMMGGSGEVGGWGKEECCAVLRTRERQGANTEQRAQKRQEQSSNPHWTALNQPRHLKNKTIVRVELSEWGVGGWGLGLG